MKDIYKNNIKLIKAQRYKATVLRVVDGDTFDVEVYLGFNLKYTIRIRLYQVNTPEVRGSEKKFGKEVTEIVASLIEHKEVIIESIDKQDSFGRWLCYVLYEDNEVEKDLGQFLLDEDNAKLLIMALDVETKPKEISFFNWRSWF